MARLRYNGLRATVGTGGLTAAATTLPLGAALTHSNGTAVPTLSGSDYIPLVILDSSGHESEIVYLTAYTSGATSGTITRGQEGTTGVTHAAGDAAICTVLAADVAQTGIIASTSYNPATMLVAGANTTIADVDATNLAVTFTAPISGTVMITLSALYTVPSLSGSHFNWHLRDGTTTVASRYVGANAQSGVQQTFAGAVLFKITGLTPGTSYTYKWAQSTSAGTDADTYAGGAAGPAVMKVEAHP